MAEMEEMEHMEDEEHDEDEHGETNAPPDQQTAHDALVRSVPRLPREPAPEGPAEQHHREPMRHRIHRIEGGSESGQEEEHLPKRSFP